MTEYIITFKCSCLLIILILNVAVLSKQLCDMKLLNNDFYEYCILK